MTIGIVFIILVVACIGVLVGYFIDNIPTAAVSMLVAVLTVGSIIVFKIY